MKTCSKKVHHNYVFKLIIRGVLGGGGGGGVVGEGWHCERQPNIFLVMYSFIVVEVDKDINR